ncbi:MAG: WD40/YVTN/BNR-like repeat-containing protein [Congregibacter sp.]
MKPAPRLARLWVTFPVALASLLTCLAIPTFAAQDEREFFDGVEARNVGPFRGGRATVATGVRQNPHLYYMGTTGGVWKTANAGASWHPISDQDFGSSAVGAIAVAPSDPNVIVVGMGESPFRNIASSQGDGVYKSTDGGQNWSHIGLEDVRQIGEIRIHPANPDVIWVAAQGNTYQPRDDGGVFRSVDGGKTWERVLEPTNESTGAVDLALDMRNPRILYAAMWDNQRTPWDLRSGGDGSGIWRSMDSGDTWERLTEDLPEGMGKIGVAASAAKPGRVWAIIEAEDDKGGLYRSDDGGDSWSQVNKERILRARSWYYMHIFADPNDENTVYVMNAPFMKSIDGGKTFAQVQTPHGDNHYLWINPDNSDWMINANDGGANVSFDAGASWSRQDNQPTAQFYRVNTDNQFEYRIYGGQQDNSTVAIRSRSRDGQIGRDDWEIQGGCESAYVAMDPNNPRYTYAGCYLGLIDEFDTQTRTSRSVKAYEETGLGQLARDAKYRFNWNAPIHVSIHDPKVIYHGGNVLLRSDNRGYNWVEASPDLTRNEDDKQGPGSGPYTNENIEQYNTIFAFAESVHDAKTLWVGSDDGLVHVTRDGGANWSDVTPSGTGRGLVNAIEVSPHDPGTAYVVVMKYKEGDNRPYVFRTTNYGRSWKSIAKGLPTEHFARVVREDPARAGLLYAGMERGLFVSFNAGKDWRAMQTNLPIVPITDLMIRRSDLVLATQGRAFWVIDDITPVREYEEAQETAAAHLYTPSMAYRLTPTEGRSGGGDSVAPSAPNGAVLYYSLADDLDLDEQTLTLEIVNSAGGIVRSLTTDKKKGVEGGGSTTSYALPAKRGINRVVWDLRSAPTTPLEYDVVFGASSRDKSLAGYHVAPGTYTARLSLDETALGDADIEVQWDPINSYDDAAIAAQQALVSESFAMINALYKRIASLQKIQEQVTLRKSLAEAAGDDTVADAAHGLLDSLTEWQESVTTPSRETFQDVLNFHPRIDAFLIDVYQQADRAVLGLTDGQRQRLNDLRPQWQAAIDAWTQLTETAVPAFNAVAGPAVSTPDWQ